jgi:hypothetical protein
MRQKGTARKVMASCAVTPKRMELRKRERKKAAIRPARMPAAVSLKVRARMSFEC